MSVFPDRPRTALVVVDVQQGVVAGNHGRDDVVANVNTLTEAARAAGAPVIWVQHSSEELPIDSEPWQIAADVRVADGEPVVHKRYGDAFEDTDLADHLAELAVGRLIVAGAQTDACIRSTLHGAFVRGYDTVLVADAHTTEDLTEWGAPPPEQVIAHTNMYWSFQSAPGRTADVVATADVTFGR